MKNREALERLYLSLDDHPTLTKCYDTLFKDLERLEKLEKAIEILKDALEPYIDFYAIEVEKRSSFIEYEDSELLKEVLNYDC